MLLLILNLLIAPAFSQITNGDDTSQETTNQEDRNNHKASPSNVYNNRKQNLDIRRLQYGRYTTGAVPTYQNGVIFSNTSGSAITFQDATTLNTAPTSVVSVSSCTLDLSGLTGIITAASTLFTIGFATVTVTVNNTTYPVMVCLYGSLNETGSSPDRGWSFLIDGKVPSVTGYSFSNTKGVYDENTTQSEQGSAAPVACFPIPKGTITNASHTFGLTLNGGAGNTIGVGNAKAQATFCVYELH